MNAEQSLREVMKLIEDGDLVRNTENDSDFMAYTKQAVRITSALGKAAGILAGESLVTAPPTGEEKS